ncbi:hypothetical protein N0V93_007346 [Gnomoniopsis smithogilvyi]|uniref:SAP domain-containing protein n=1 Tax=Gnomoniopsis smithogilvyi TaxID=1191159 RepID=A0A9W8YRM5_9PEZI|nr:hypothetical protein N0V93_007346 [Gnomoniopsis smithogilvyi]
MTDWNSLRVVDLRAELTRRGLPTKGVKADLVQRLTEDDGNAAQAEEEPLEGDKTAIVEAASTVENAPEPEVPENQTVAKEATSTDATASEQVTTRSEPAPNTEVEPNVEVKADTSQDLLPSENHTAQPEHNEQPHLDTPLPSADTAADLQKRKRRSSTPPPSTKRARQEGERLAEEREDVVDFDNGEISISPKKSQNGVGKRGLPDDVEMVDERQEDLGRPESSELLPTSSAPARGPSLVETEESTYAKQEAIADSSNEIPAQSKDESLNATNEVGTHQHPTQIKQDPRDDVKPEEEPSALPSLHAPTSALYIRELMRPLRSEVMEQHIIDLVTPLGKETEPDLIRDFYLDQIRTHAFVLLASVPIAQRVRAVLHNKVWPNERNRKPLWVDFIPAESVKDWIAKEESAPRNARWEVVYDQDGGNAVAVHREIGTDSKSFSRPPPTGPAATANPIYPGIEAAPRGPRGGGGRPPFQNTNIRHTETSPQLAYTPKDEDVARRRMENMRSFYSRDPPADLGKDYHRFTFESADAFVDRGREVFIGIRPPHRQKEHEERLRRERLGTVGANSVAESRRDDYRPAPRPTVTDEDRFSRYNDGRRSDRPPRNRGFRSDRGPGRFRGEDPYRYRPGY